MAKNASHPESTTSARELSISAEELPALAAGLVHEAKNPLASIHLHLQLLEGYLQEVENEELRSKLQQKARFIKSEIRGLDQSLHNFLKLVRQERQIGSHSIDLDSILQGVLELMAPQARQAGIEMEFQSGQPGLLNNVDEGFIKQIAINLIINSIQAISDAKSDPDKSDSVKKIIIRTGRRDSLVFMVVADNGPGIPDDIQERIFEPYFSTKKSRGSGIGLTLVKKMVAEMNAHLEIQSQSGKGTSVSILFNQKES